MKRIYTFVIFAAFCVVSISHTYAAEYVDDDDPKVDDNGYINPSCDLGKVLSCIPLLG